MSFVMWYFLIRIVNFVKPLIFALSRKRDASVALECETKVCQTQSGEERACQSSAGMGKEQSAVSTIRGFFAADGNVAWTTKGPAS